MDNFNFENIKNLEITLPFFSTFSAIIFAALFGEWIAFLYSKFGKTLSNRKAFSDIFWLLAMTTTIVIMVVKFSLALSLGLVGALSIVRFRAAIKEPEELVYLFLVIAIGIACGAGQLKAAGMLLIISSVVFYMKDRWFQKKINSIAKDYTTGSIITVSGSLEDREKATIFFNKLIGFNNYKLVSMNVDNQNFESVYTLTSEVDSDTRKKIFDWATGQKNKNFTLRYGAQALIA